METIDRGLGGDPLTAAPVVGDAGQLQRLVELRSRLAEERRLAATPAVARALEMAEQQLFLGLGYFGYSDRLFPEED
ncbi:hypothetical protein [Blastococcus sp. SYSU D00820]